MHMRRICSALCLALALAAWALPGAATAQIACIGNEYPPPELPVYDQPPIPEPGFIWAPGYWACGPYGYFWVPGTWVLPPDVGLLWTPGYWAWGDGFYLWIAGYWALQIGFYGGIDYGYGYTGFGYEGGYWDNGVFAYNRTVNNFGRVRITHVYERDVIVAPGATRVSFNGGSGGTKARPTPEQEAAAHEPHVAASPAQLKHERTASEDKSLLASENHGRPSIAATAKPGEFTGKGVVAARDEKTPVVPRGEKPAAVTPGSNPLPPGKTATPPKEPPKEVNRDVKPPVPPSPPHPEVKPPPPHPASSAKPPPPPPPHVVAAPKPPPPPPPHPAPPPKPDEKKKPPG